ncbi:MAG: family 16 glycosylhydrolase [Bacteroidales bacterium]|nr:family 16 glycosylhydrolase [Bacteroidales bacterium]MCF8455287.1 family 16 glycosylhydrolase [Bacteroidales bacterium]
MKKLVFIVVLFWICSMPSYSQFFSDNCSGGTNILPVQDINLCNDSEWVLVFEDNFDGDSLDLTKWKESSGRGSLITSPNQDVQTLRNAIVENGILNLIAKPEHVKDLVITWKDTNEILSDGLPNYRWFDYTAALIMPIKKFPYGYFEASCKIPAGKGIWPAMWEYGAYQDEYNNTIEQELDVFEFCEGKTKIIRTNIHHDGDVCPAKYRGTDYSKDFHTFGLLWEPYMLEWYVDGELIRRYSRYTQNGSDAGCRLNAWQPYQEAPFPKESMTLFLSTGVDKRDGQKPDGSTPFPSKFQIDWTRYYVREDLMNSTKQLPFNSLVYPNPNQGTITVEVDVTYSDKVQIRILSIQLNPVFEKYLPGNVHQLSIDFLENGLYFLQVENTETHQCDFHKIIISK